MNRETHLGHSFQNIGNTVDFSDVIRDIRVRGNVITNKFKPV